MVSRIGKAASWQQRPIVQFAIGAFLGICLYHNLILNNSKNHPNCKKRLSLLKQHLKQNDNPWVKDPDVLLAQLVPQPQVEKFIGLSVKSSSPKFTQGDNPEYAHRFWMPYCGKNCHYPTRSFRQLNWDKANDIENRTARVVWTDIAMTKFGIIPKADAKNKKKNNKNRLMEYQRTNHLPHGFSMKGGFGLYRLDKEISGDVASMARISPYFRDMIPFHTGSTTGEHKTNLERLMGHIQDNKGTTYEVVSVEDMETQAFCRNRRDFEKLINGKNINKLEHWMMEPYVCNQLIWNGMHFVIRVFWLVASLDPLTVLYQDGFGRVGYNRTDWSNMKKDDEVLPWNDVEQFLWHTWKHSRHLRHNNIDDPVVHVRNQAKEAIVHLVHNYKSTAFTKPETTEDAFELMAMDIIVDTDLDVHVQAVHTDTTYHDENYPMMLEDYYFLMEKNHELYYSMIMILDEVWDKQQQKGKSILPLQKTGKFQLVVAGNAWYFNRQQQIEEVEDDSKKKKKKKKKKRRKREKTFTCKPHKDSKQYPSARRVYQGHPAGW